MNGGLPSKEQSQRIPERFPVRRPERGALHIIGIGVFLVSAFSTLMLFDGRYRYDRLEKLIAEQSARIDALEARIRWMSGGVRTR